MIGRRLERLGEQARKVLTAAAVVGRTFPLDVLQACVDLSDDEVLEAIEEADRAQLVAADASQRTARYGMVIGPGTPQLSAALAADAAGLVDRSREHFETALGQAHEVPMRLLEPTVLCWYGRALSVALDAADRARGRAMVEASAIDFRALEMVVHTNLAEQFLRGEPTQVRRLSRSEP